MENTSSSNGESESENDEGCGMEVVVPEPLLTAPTDAASAGAALSTRQRKAVEVRETPRPLRGSEKAAKIKMLEPTRGSSSRSTASSSRIDAASAPSSSSTTGGAVAQDENVPTSNKAQRLESAPAPIPGDGDLLDDRDVADTDELYSENERALTQFIKLHPMLRYATPPPLCTTFEFLQSLHYCIAAMHTPCSQSRCYQRADADCRRRAFEGHPDRNEGAGGRF